LKKKILIAGQTGMVGSSIYRLIKKKKLYKIIECKRKDLDFTSQSSVDQWFKKNKPEIVINAAGKVGGILDNSTYQSDYLYINTMIGLNLINSSLKYNVKKFINLGSACIYPKNVKQPITEDSLLSSQLEKSNEGYAIAKIACLKYCQYLKKKYKKNFISIQPANLYGEGDNFNLKSSHVLPALVKKFVIAKKKNFKSVEVWGSGKARREFLNVNDLANAILFLLTKKIKEDYINIGSGEQVSIKQLALSIKQTVDYKGKVIFNKKYPDGVMRRQINSQSIKKLGWQANIKLKQGLIEYCNYYIKKVMPLENENL
tara:strand:- start:2928 stop:3872 length:945 start_codon:yes stop_codon:yes gene_type:complete